MRRADLAMTALAVVVLFSVGVAPRAGGAEEPEITVKASAEEIFFGETVDYLVEVSNMKTPAAPDLSALRGDFEVASLGDESRNQSSMFIINGRVTQQTSFGHVYRYRLTPKRTGRLTIAAPSVVVDGRTISGRSLALDVISPEAQDVVIPEIKTSRPRVYPTQPFDVTLRVLVRPLPDEADRDPLSPLRRRPPHLEINWVDPPAGLTGNDKMRWVQEKLADDGVGFTLNEFTLRSISLFEGPPAAVLNLYQGRESRNGLDGRPVNYFVYELKRTLTAEKAGTYKLGPALVKGTFVTDRDGSSYRGRPLVAVAPALAVEVRDVPTPRPAAYCGGIGNYRVAATAAPTSLRVGDPLTLALEIERRPGSGSLGQISAPDLGASTQLAADFEIIDRNPTGRSEGDVKRFEYALRPKRTGVGIPALSVVVFNPESETFSEIATRPIALSVSEASRVGAGDLVGAPAGSGTSQIRSRAQGIFQNVTDPTELVDERVNITALAGIAAGSWLAAACLMVVVSTHRRKSGDQVWQRRRSARRTAERRLAEARRDLAEGRSREALRAVRAALVGLIADMRNIVAEGLTASEADAVLERTSVSPDNRASVLRLLEAIESAEYGPGAGTEAPAMIDQAVALLPGVARQLGRGS
jgi:hypothetical protein